MIRLVSRIKKLQPGDQRRVAPDLTGPDERDGGHLLAKARRVPAEDRVGLAPVQPPVERGGQLQPGGPGRAILRRGPPQLGYRPVERGRDLRPEVVREPNRVPAAVDDVGDVEAARAGGKGHRAPVPGGRAQRGIAVVLGCPAHVGRGRAKLPGPRLP
jgi:hypothetical protein